MLLQAREERKRPPSLPAGVRKILLNFKELIIFFSFCSRVQEKDQLFYKEKLCSVLMCYCKN